MTTENTDPQTTRAGVPLVDIQLVEDEGDSDGNSSEDISPSEILEPLGTATLAAINEFETQREEILRTGAYQNVGNPDDPMDTGILDEPTVREDDNPAASFCDGDPL